MVNFARSAIESAGGVVGFLKLNFVTGPGVTGWIMTLCLLIIVWFSIDKRKNANYEKFWFTHHLFIVFFICWQLHGCVCHALVRCFVVTLHSMFCMVRAVQTLAIYRPDHAQIRPDRPPFCSFQNIASFWKYWLVGGVIYIAERILREVRSRHRTYISKVIQHPSRVLEIQVRKEKTTTRAGQYVFLVRASARLQRCCLKHAQNCPEISYWQWHRALTAHAGQPHA